MQEADTEVLEFGATKKASKANNKWQTEHNTFFRATQMCRTGQVNLWNENKSFNWLKENVTIIRSLRCDYITVHIPARPNNEAADSGVDCDLTSIRVGIRNQVNQFALLVSLCPLCDCSTKPSSGDLFASFLRATDARVPHHQSHHTPYTIHHKSQHRRTTDHCAPLSNGFGVLAQ